MGAKREEMTPEEFKDHRTRMWAAVQRLQPMATEVFERAMNIGLECSQEDENLPKHIKNALFAAKQVQDKMLANPQEVKNEINGQVTFRMDYASMTPEQIEAEYQKRIGNLTGGGQKLLPPVVIEAQDYSVEDVTPYGE